MSENNKTINHVMVVGGGSAGWLTAAIIAAEYETAGDGGIAVTLVESPDVPTVGVGEGTWPSMRGTLQRIGVSETDFLRECDASFKQGSRFIDWLDGNGEDYFHPFTPPLAFQQLNLAPYWQKEGGARPFADAVGVQAEVSRRALAPKLPSMPEYAFALNYGYHLDAGKFAAFLQRHCTEKLGVQHIKARVSELREDASGYIEVLITDSGAELGADLFVDCTGAAALLIGKHYGVDLRPQQQVLFNDRALAMQVGYESDDLPIASCTHSIARSSGWVWDIGLPSRRGIGYTYSSAHSTDEAAEKILCDYVERFAGGHKLVKAEPRKIRFEPGYREKFWHRNCVAIGMSAGFIEPLEASALVMIEKSAQMLAEQLPAHRSGLAALERRFNRRFSGHWERIIEFLKLHYVLSRRNDSDYWRDHRAEATVPLQLLDALSIWRSHPASANDGVMADELFPAASFQYVLSGMEFLSDVNALRKRADRSAQALALMQDNLVQGEKLLKALPGNRQLLKQVQSVALPTI